MNNFSGGISSNKFFWFYFSRSNINIVLNWLVVVLFYVFICKSITAIFTRPVTPPRYLFHYATPPKRIKEAETSQAILHMKIHFKIRTKKIRKKLCVQHMRLPCIYTFALNSTIY